MDNTSWTQWMKERTLNLEENVLEGYMETWRGGQKIDMITFQYICVWNSQRLKSIFSSDNLFFILIYGIDSAMIAGRFLWWPEITI